MFFFIISFTEYTLSVVRKTDVFKMADGNLCEFADNEFIRI